MDPHSRLEAFRSTSKLTYAQLAKRIRCHRAMAHHLCTGKRRPGLGLAARIEVATSGWALGPVRCFEWARDDRERAA